MISAFTCLPVPRCWFIEMRTSDVTQLMDLALGLWFPFVRIMAFLRYMPVLDNSALTARADYFVAGAGDHHHAVDPPSHSPQSAIAQQPDPDGGANFMGHVIRADVSVLFLALQLAGQILSFNMGMSMAVMNDPSSGASTTVLAELINVYAILLFLPWTGICCW